LTVEEESGSVTSAITFRRQMGQAESQKRRRTMVRRLVVVLGGVSLCLAGLSCRRLPDNPTHELLKTEPIASVEAIPAEYGNLVSVTERGPGSALLWFERPDKTIVVVGLVLQGDDAYLADRVALVPRSSQ
jgi:hypothetical protein